MSGAISDLARLKFRCGTAAFVGSRLMACLLRNGGSPRAHICCAVRQISQSFFDGRFPLTMSVEFLGKFVRATPPRSLGDFFSINPVARAPHCAFPDKTCALAVKGDFFFGRFPLTMSVELLFGKFVCATPPRAVKKYFGHFIFYLSCRGHPLVHFTLTHRSGDQN